MKTGPVPYKEIFLAIAVIVIAARLAARIFRRYNQPPVIGEILAGLLLGLTALGRLPGHLDKHLFPMDAQPFLKAIAALGLVLFMFIVGLEIDLKVVRGQERLATAVSLASIALPFAGGVLLGLSLYGSHRPPVPGQRHELTFALFIGAAMSITAFPVLARILTDRGMLRTPLGSAALACAAVDDVVAWSLLALVVALAGSGGHGSTEWHIWLTIPYLILMLTVVRGLLTRVVARYNSAGRLTPDILAVVLVFVLLSAYATEWLGIHYIFGAFLVGAVMPRVDTAKMFQEILERLEQVSVLLLLPVFFVVTGLAVDFGNLGSGWYWQLPLVLLVAIGGKFLGAYGAARFQGVPRNRGAALAVLMNTRGLTEIVILTVGRDKGVLQDDLFSMLILMAVVTTVMTGPLLRVVYSDRRLNRDIAEAERAALGVTNAHRVLVATPDPTNDVALIETATALARSKLPGELVLAQIRAPAVPSVEVGSGVAFELDALAGALETIESVRQRVEASGMPAVSFVRMSTDPAAELQTMADSLEADVLVYEGDDTADRGLVAVTCQLVRIHPDAPLRAPCIQLVHTAGNDGDAAAEIALRLAAGSGRPLAIVDANSASGRQLSRRALGLVTAATRAGIVVLTGPSQEPCLTVGPVGAGTAPAVEAHVSVRAEEDREIVPAEQMVRQITIVAPASVEPAAP